MIGFGLIWGSFERCIVYGVSVSVGSWIAFIFNLDVMIARVSGNRDGSTNSSIYLLRYTVTHEKKSLLNRPTTSFPYFSSHLHCPSTSRRHTRTLPTNSHISIPILRTPLFTIRQRSERV
jgi:hypothetical protein